ncbi:MAG: asparagine synthase (glutamine-hydrolyzing) [Bdellovibrionales bacterium]|jgi:asparagine synthase (glutamine-hydrolysing)
MCGLAGFIQWSGIGDGEGESLLTNMTDALAHRGPNDAGAWIDSAAGVALGHRRLAIVDLSPAGHQPMTSASGRFVIVFNGEIYNHGDLRKGLQETGRAPAAWKGHSDTETLVAGFDAWGIEATIRKTRGMFALAVWDKKEKSLTLARDRLGEKPLYYGWQRKGGSPTFLFASQVAALREHPSFEGEIDRDGLCLLLRHNCIGGASSIYRGIHKLEAGCLLTLAQGEQAPTITRYWSGADVAREGVLNPFQGSPQEAVDALEVLLKDAVQSQMMADVPLGAFLSGGIDSSTIVALMQASASRPVKTFSIGFQDALYDEAAHAKAVAQHLGTDHTELYVTPQQAMDVIPSLPRFYDEPFADSSQIPTFLVSQLARQHVTVSLSGDGGDELFCGYTRYQLTASAWSRLAKIPLPLRRLMARVITAIPPQSWNRGVALMTSLTSRKPSWSNVGDKMHKGANALASPSVSHLYGSLVSHWSDPASIVIEGQEPPTMLTSLSPDMEGLDDVQRMMALDMLSYMPDDILTKVDRAAMAVSLETRVPLLDPRVVAFAWSLPQSIKIRDGQTKWPLRQVLDRYVPRELIERPKMGFGVPLDSWLRGPLKTWAEDLLDETRLRREGFFNPKPIREKWRDHLSGKRNWAYPLWDILMFEAWLEHNKP